MDNRTAPQDAFRYRPEDVAAFAERFTLEPVEPAAVRERVDGGQVLHTTDVPRYLDRPIACDADTGIALYRLVQLFGTPNVPGLEAGGDQPARERTTWQYLFRAQYRPASGDGGDSGDGGGGGDEAADSDPAGPLPAESRSDLLSVYDYETGVSVGVSAWHRPDGTPDRQVPEPVPDPLPGTPMPAEPHLDALVTLVLATVEHAVEATYRDLRV